MAKNLSYTIKIKVDGKDVEITTRSVKGLGEAINATRTNAQRFNDIGFAFQNFSNAIQQLTVGMHTYTAAFALQQRAETSLATIMRERMSATDAKIYSVKQLAVAQQQLGVVGDEVQLMGAQQLSMFLQEANSINILLPAMNNLLVQQHGVHVTGEQAADTAKTLGKAMQGNTDALRRMGIMLDDVQKGIMKQGTESQRASVLVEALTSRTGDLNVEMAKTGAGKMQQAANAFGDFQEKIGAVIAPYEAFINTVAMSTLALGGLFTAVRGLYTALAPLAVTLLKNAAGLRNVRAITLGWGGALDLLKAKMTGATVTMTATNRAVLLLKGSLGALMRMTGIGLVIWGVSEAVSALTDSTNDASEAMRDLTNEQRRQQRESEVVGQKVGDLLGQYTLLQQQWGQLKTDADKMDFIKKHSGFWDNLGKSVNTVVAAQDAYVNQADKVIAAIVAIAEADAYSDLYKEAVTAREKEWYHRNKSIKTGDYYVPLSKGEENNIYLEMPDEWKAAGLGVGDYYIDTVDRAGGAIRTEYSLQRQGIDKINAYRKQQAVRTNAKLEQGYDENVEHYKRKMNESYAKAEQAKNAIGFGMGRNVPTSPTTHRGNNTAYELKEIADAKTYEELANNIRYYDEQLRKTNPADKESITNLAKKKAAAEQGQKAIEAMVEAATMQDFSQVTAEQIQDEKTLKAAQAYWEWRKENAKTDEERKQIGTHIVELDKLRDAWDKLYQDVEDAPEVLPEKLHTLKEITKAVQYLQEKQQEQSGEELAATTAIISKLNQKADALQRVTRLQEMQDELSSFGTGTMTAKIELKAIGLDGIKDRLRELQAMLDDMNNPPTEQQRKGILQTMDTYRQYQKQLLKSFDTYRKGWDNLKGVGNGIQSLTDALEGNGNAWQKLTSIIDACLSVYDGIKQVVAFVNMLTEATRIQTLTQEGETVAKLADTAATGAHTAATMADTAASKAQSAANASEAITSATKEGAKKPWPASLVAIATGVAAVVAALAMVGSFSEGGVVGGSSPTGDRLYARVNSGEMILNRRQQENMLRILSGRAAIGAGLNYGSLRGAMDGSPVRLELKLRGDTLIATADRAQLRRMRS